jgi:hypothetical protein
VHRESLSKLSQRCFVIVSNNIVQAKLIATLAHSQAIILTSGCPCHLSNPHNIHSTWFQHVLINLRSNSIFPIFQRTTHKECASPVVPSNQQGEGNPPPTNVVDFFPARVHNSFPYHPPHHKSSRKQCMQRFFEFSLDHLAKRSICTSFADCVVGLGNFLADLLFFVSSH